MKQLAFPPLPIVEHLEALGTGIRENPLSLIESSPGSGKTTILPLFLLQQDWLHGRSIIVLQPRRLAAKSVATRMAELLKEDVGKTVGYQIRLEQRRSSSTRIEVLTEGLLTRRLISNPELSGVGAILFDEFHERSVHADIALALSREVLSVLRPDLRIVLMSATLQSLKSDAQFGAAWRYSFSNTPHPVQIRYAVPEARKALWEECARVVKGAIDTQQGDILAFLPGRYEIERCAERLRQVSPGVEILPLYADLPYELQQRALVGQHPDRRRVILSTPIAETSLTIEGVRVVVDSGLHKVARSDSAGVSELHTERISLDSAEQRAGRAGRTSPGICIRMWSEAEHSTLRQAREPEIARSDLTQSLLDLFVWGVRDPATFPWITPPSERSLKLAHETLIALGAVGPDGIITERGRQLARLGTHPRLGALILEGRRCRVETHAAAIVTLIEDGRIARSSYVVDLQREVETLIDQGNRASGGGTRSALFGRWLSTIKDTADSGTLAPSPQLSKSDCIGYLLAVAFPERIARRRVGSSERYLLASGQGASLLPKDPLAQHEFLVVAALQQREGDSLILQATSLNPRLFDSPLSHVVSHELISQFDTARGSLQTAQVSKVGAIILREELRPDLSHEERLAALCEYVKTPEGHARLPFSAQARRLQQRCDWARRQESALPLPDISDYGLRNSEPFWLSGFLPASGRLSDIDEQCITQALQAQYSWEASQALDALAPETIKLPRGAVRLLDYSGADAPALDAVIQELFGWGETPTVGSLMKPVTVRLLSPARRPMQVTRDLASFWRSGYLEVRKELRGRYPKHRWPEDPSKQD
jgi:ATP-dependent helicase HrpB